METVKEFIRNEQWEEASAYADRICIMAVTKDLDWIWKQASVTLDSCSNDFSFEGWNECSFGNTALLIHRGRKISERKELAEKWRQFLLKKLA